MKLGMYFLNSLLLSAYEKITKVIFIMITKGDFCLPVNLIFHSKNPYKSLRGTKLGLYSNFLDKFLYMPSLAKNSQWKAWSP